jgi:DNA polymerase-4
LQFLHALPVEELWGVGPATLAGLQKLGIVTVGDLSSIPEPTLIRNLGPSQGRHLLALASGIDSRTVVPDTASKSISVEETYSVDLEGRSLVEAALLAHSQQLAQRLRQAGLGARTISLKVRFADFTTVTRSRTVAHVISQPRDLYRVGLDLLTSVPDDQSIRLLGLGGSSFELAEAPGQISIEDEDAWHRVGDAVAEVQDRFGVSALKPARLLGDGRERMPGSDPDKPD